MSSHNLDWLQPLFGELVVRMKTGFQDWIQSNHGSKHDTLHGHRLIMRMVQLSNDVLPSLIPHNDCQEEQQQDDELHRRH